MALDALRSRPGHLRSVVLDATLPPFADNLSPVGVVAVGKRGFAPASNEALLAELTAVVQGDPSPRCVIFFSNGAFGGIIKKFAQAV